MLCWSCKIDRKIDRTSFAKTSFWWCWIFIACLQVQCVLVFSHPKPLCFASSEHSSGGQEGEIYRERESGSIPNIWILQGYVPSFSSVPLIICHSVAILEIGTQSCSTPHSPFQISCIQTPFFPSHQPAYLHFGSSPGWQVLLFKDT